MEEEVVPPDWSLAEIADSIAAGLSRRSLADRREQAVRGLDSLNELQLHAVLESILVEAGFGVQREQRYPVARGRRRRSEGERCDFVLTPPGCPLTKEEAVATLFAPAHTTAASQALWLEVKVVAQFTEEGGNRSYASELQHPVRRDAVKLAREEAIEHAALLLVLFTDHPRTAQHDLEVWEKRSEERGVSIRGRYLRHVDVLDRLGNSCCTIALLRVKGW